MNTEISQRLSSIDSRDAQIVHLLRTLTDSVVELNHKLKTREFAANQDVLEEYDFVYLVAAGQGRWVWKHFLRGTRSARQFASREEAVNDARRDAALSIRTRGLVTRS